MPSGAAVIKYDGRRGVVWRIKFRDADGRQVQETLGRQAEGWTRKKAEAELRARLTDVRREGLRKVESMTFQKFANDWLSTYPDSAGLKTSTRTGYDSIVARHLNPTFGHLRLEGVTVGHVEHYIAAKRKGGFAARTINRHVNLLSLILGAALRGGFVRANPIPLVRRPREPRRRWRILSPDEVRAVERAFDVLIAEAEGEERVWREQARVVFLTLAGTGLRRGELLGLRWHTVRLADPEGPSLRVEETVVNGRADTPKSEAGERTIALGPRLADELFEHRRRTAFAGDGERVFCHPSLGSPLDHKRYAETFRLALGRAEVDGVVRPFHDLRHGSITNAAAAGTPPAALMTRAGHSDFKTTQAYIDLAGEAFRDEAVRLERRLWGDSGTKNRYKIAVASSREETENPG